MKVDIVYTRVSQDDDLDRIGSRFCDEHGDNEHGVIPDAEYDRLYDLLGEVASRYASYSDDGEDTDFMGSRYVDQVPWITLVAADEADPSIALKIALETIQSAHRPMAVSFDYYPDSLLILPPNIVYSTFEPEKLTEDG